jgi:hypothetical protein
MKMWVYLCIIAGAYSTGDSQTLLPNNLAANLVGEWLFDNSGSDKSANANHVVINNSAELDFDRYGNANSALNFTANGGGGNSLLNMNIVGNADRTISFWTKFANQGTYYNGGYNKAGGYTQTRVEWGDYSSSGAKCYWSQASDGHLWFQAHYLDIWNPNPNNLPMYNEWRMVTFVYNGSMSTAQEYLNDAAQFASNLQVNTYGNGSTLSTINTPLTIVGSAGDYIDDVRIFNKALTAYEVSQLYLAVPEPSALSLLAIGLGGLAMMRRRRS